VKVVTIAAWMFLMGAVLWWATFFILPLAVQWEIPLATVDRMPIFGFCAGVLLGLAMALSKPVRNSAGYVAGAIMLGVLVWLFVVGIVGLGLSVGGFEDEAFEGAMETVNTVATWLACIASVGAIAAGAYAVLYDKTGVLLERFRPKPPKAR
jgi:hypothetical protein